MKLPLLPIFLLAACGALSLHAEPSTKLRPIAAYTDRIPPESDAANADRHRRISARRAQEAVIIVHRGAAAFAPENTLEAYAAAMDYGADGCEVDLRRTADGVLVLFHDDMLDHLTDGFGTVPQLTYYQLLALRPRFSYGSASPSTRPPTFAALLELARQRSMLLHLDVKEPGLDAQIGEMLNQADMWDHVTAINTATAPTLAKDPRVKPLRFKGPGIYADRKDMDPAAVRSQLSQPGQAIMVDDPRVAARELGRKAYNPVPLPPGLRRIWEPSRALVPGEINLFIPWAHLESIEATTKQPADLLALLRTGKDEARFQVDGNSDYNRQRTAQIVERAWAAQRLGKSGVKSRAIVEALEFQVSHRSLHRDWMYHGLDGALAARALGLLKANESAPLLIAAFKRIDRALEKVQNKEFGPNPLAWTDFRVKMYIIPALGELRCARSKAFLQEYVSMSEKDARELAPLQFEEATRALFRQDLAETEVEALLRHPQSAVRGTAILECLDHPTRRRTLALKACWPWALHLPRATQ